MRHAAVRGGFRQGKKPSRQHPREVQACGDGGQGFWEVKSFGGLQREGSARSLYSSAHTEEPETVCSESATETFQQEATEPELKVYTEGNSKLIGVRRLPRKLESFDALHGGALAQMENEDEAHARLPDTHLLGGQTMKDGRASTSASATASSFLRLALSEVSLQGVPLPSAGYVSLCAAKVQVLPCPHYDEVCSPVSASVSDVPSDQMQPEIVLAESPLLARHGRNVPSDADAPDLIAWAALEDVLDTLPLHGLERSTDEGNREEQKPRAGREGKQLVAQERQPNWPELPYLAVANNPTWHNRARRPKKSYGFSREDAGETKTVWL